MTSSTGSPRPPSIGSSNSRWTIPTSVTSRVRCWRGYIGLRARSSSWRCANPRRTVHDRHVTHPSLHEVIWVWTRVLRAIYSSLAETVAKAPLSRARILLGLIENVECLQSQPDEFVAAVQHSLN